MLDALVFIVVAFLLTAAGRQLVAFSYPPAVAEPPATPLPQKEGGEEHTPSAPPSLRGPASERGKGDGGVGLRLTTLERNLLGFGLGLGLFGYVILGMLLLGSVGHHLRPGFSFLVLLPFLGLQTSQWPAMWRELRQTKLPRLTPAGWGAALVFALFATTALVGVYSPPTQLEWDALAYHLADPKLFIAQGRIVPLPWESHSEFAFNTEMWYTFGLLNGGIPLAKLFHFACGAGAALTIYAFGRRFFSHAVGVVGALIFVSTPLVFWEAGAAYADLATTYFTALTGLAVALWLAFPQRPPRSPKFGGENPKTQEPFHTRLLMLLRSKNLCLKFPPPKLGGPGGPFLSCFCPPP